MPAVNIAANSALAAKVYSAAVFAGVQAAPGFMKLNSGAAPQQGDAAAKLKGQSPPGYPIVKVFDLSANPGTRVSVDLFNIFQGKPVMGDKRLANKGMSTSSASQDVDIQRSRYMADTGGKVAQKRTRWDLRNVVKAGLVNIGQRLEDQRCLVQLAGARGSQNHADWTVPLATDPEFSEIMVNSVRAPTYNRRFFSSASATSVANLGVGDILTLGDVSRIGSILKESNVPLQTIMMNEDPYKWDKPLYVMWVSERQWEYMKNAAGSTWQAKLQAAVKRFEGGDRHPLFMGDSILENGILIRPLGRYAIRFNPGDTITEATSASTYTETTATVPSTTNFNVDRAIIVGAQALVKAYGNEGNVDYFYRWTEEWTDHQSVLEVAISMMEGTSKVRFNVNGTDTDHGVAVVDSYAPPINSSEGQTAMALTKK